MAAQDEHPVFNLKAVVRETGVKPDTLRAWERRYGLPHPHRSDSGHRLYSQHDIDIIHWLVERQAEGMTIGNAIDLWNSLVSENIDPTREMSRRQQELPAPPTDGTDMVGYLRQQWINACLDFDEQRAVQAVTDALGRFSVETVVLDILSAALRDIGTGWFNGEITVQQEHFASGLAVRKLEALLAATPPPTRRETIVVAAPPGEIHAFSFLLIVLLLKRRGWLVVDMGINTPVDNSLEEMLAAIKPDLVVSGAQRLITAASLYEMAEAVMRSGSRLAYGGLIFTLLPQLTSIIPGQYLGNDIARAPYIVETLFDAPAAQPSTDHRPSDAHRALIAFSDGQPAVEAVLHAENTDFLSREHLDLANMNLGASIRAALELGDIRLIENDLAWLGSYLAKQGIPLHYLQAYLGRYARAVEACVGESAAMVADYLSGYEVSSLPGDIWHG